LAVAATGLLVVPALLIFALAVLEAALPKPKLVERTPVRPQLWGASDKPVIGLQPKSILTLRRDGFRRARLERRERQGQGFRASGQDATLRPQ
jgi:hypothetical protein